VCLGGVLMILPSFLLVNYVSMTMLFMVVWLTGFIVLNQQVMQRYFLRMRGIKRERGWGSEKQTVIKVDTEVSRYKDTFPVAARWYFVPLVIWVFGVFSGMPWDFPEGIGLVFWLMQGVSLITLLLFYCFHRMYAKMPSKVFCDNTEVNMTLNRVEKRAWTRCMLVLAIFNSIFMLVVSIVMLLGESMPENAVVMMVLIGGLVLFPFIHAFQQVRGVRNHLLRLVHEEVYVDDEDYWVFGTMFYNNPNDKNIIIDKRLGYGMTMNLASVAGKITMWILAVTMVGMVGLSIWLIPVDFGNVSLRRVGEEIMISAPASLNFTFHVSEIQRIELLEEMPRAARNFGTGTPRLSIGNFSVSGFGTSQLYIHRESPPFIFIELADKRIFVNQPTPTDTRAFYRELRHLTP